MKHVLLEYTLLGVNIATGQLIFLSLLSFLFGVSDLGHTGWMQGNRCYLRQEKIESTQCQTVKVVKTIGSRGRHRGLYEESRSCRNARVCSLSDCQWRARFPFSEQTIALKKHMKLCIDFYLFVLGNLGPFAFVLLSLIYSLQT